MLQIAELKTILAGVVEATKPYAPALHVCGGASMFLLLLLRRKPVAESGDAQALKSIADTQAQIIVMLNKVGFTLR